MDKPIGSVWRVRRKTDGKWLSNKSKFTHRGKVWTRKGDALQALVWACRVKDETAFRDKYDDEFRFEIFENLELVEFTPKAVSQADLSEMIKKPGLLKNMNLDIADTATVLLDENLEST